MQIYRSRTFNALNAWLCSPFRLSLNIAAWERRVRAFGQVTRPALDTIVDEALCRLGEQTQDVCSVPRIIRGDGRDRATWLLEGWPLEEASAELQCYDYLLYLTHLRDYLGQLKQAGELEAK